MARTKCPVCNKHACFAFNKSDKQRYCKQHATNGMINVKHSRCVVDDCNKIPNFNLRNEKVALYCKQHASAEMIDVKNKKCLNDDCNKIRLSIYQMEKLLCIVSNMQVLR